MLQKQARWFWVFIIEEERFNAHINYYTAITTVAILARNYGVCIQILESKNLFVANLGKSRTTDDFLVAPFNVIYLGDVTPWSILNSCTSLLIWKEWRRWRNFAQNSNICPSSSIFSQSLPWIMIASWLLFLLAMLLEYRRVLYTFS